MILSLDHEVSEEEESGDEETDVKADKCVQSSFFVLANTAY